MKIVRGMFYTGLAFAYLKEANAFRTTLKLESHWKLPPEARCLLKLWMRRAAMSAVQVVRANETHDTP